MGAYREPRERPLLIECGVVPESWVDGIGKIEVLGGGAYRIKLYRVHRPVDDGPIEHEVVFSVLTNLAHVGSAVMLLQALAGGAIERARMLLQ